MTDAHVPSLLFPCPPSFQPQPAGTLLVVGTIRLALRTIVTQNFQVNKFVDCKTSSFNETAFNADAFRAVFVCAHARFFQCTTFQCSLLCSLFGRADFRCSNFQCAYSHAETGHVGGSVMQACNAEHFNTPTDTAPCFNVQTAHVHNV